MGLVWPGIYEDAYAANAPAESTLTVLDSIKVCTADLRPESPREGEALLLIRTLQFW